MPEHPAFTRRQFLASGLAMVSTVTSVPTFLSRSASVLAADTTMRLSSKPGVPEDRVLVVIQLSGGNDGLNTVVPYGMSEYYRARPGIAIPEAQVLRVAGGNHVVGLHPAMTDLRDLIGEGLASVIQGVGYPNPNRSHFASMDVWHTGVTNPGGGNGVHGRGWIGRALDGAVQSPKSKVQSRESEGGGVDEGLACVCLGSEAPLAAQGEHVKPVAFDRPDVFRWTARDLHPALSEAYDSLLEEPGPGGAAGGADDPAAFVFRTACDAQVASSRVRRAVAQKSATAFPRSGLAQQLEMVAAMIRAELPTRVYYVAMGGFDTHANQAYPHQRLLGEFSQAMLAFQRELTATGHRGRVMTMAFSEFGRRVGQNASGGTDHGAAGPLFLFGDHLRQPGVLGMHPSLSDLDAGDLKYQVDFRSVYADVLEGWLKLDTAAALGRKYRPTGAVKG